MPKNPLSAIDLKPIQEALGPETQLPDLPAGPIGRFRLVETLRGRYGDNFRIIPGARNALKHFDKETDMLKAYAEKKVKIMGASEENE
jgi:hypothetical protein